VKVNGKLCYLWRAVDHEGEVLEAVVTATSGSFPVFCAILHAA
jgi:transposase-like protein